MHKSPDLPGTIVSRRQQMRDDLHSLAMLIGLRPAARRLGISEGTAGKWSHKYQWRLAAHLKPFGAYTNKHPETNGKPATEAIAEVLNDAAADTKLFMSSAARSASYAAAGTAPDKLFTRDASQSALNWTRTADMVHGWSADRTKAPVVNVANITLPPAEQLAKTADLDDKLDAIVKRLG